MPGSSFRQSVASTPPSWMGTSTDSLLRLSVIVMLSVTAASLLVVRVAPKAGVHLQLFGPEATAQRGLQDTSKTSWGQLLRSLSGTGPGTSRDSRFHARTE